jgi:hypothetical protein
MNEKAKIIFNKVYKQQMNFITPEAVDYLDLGNGLYVELSQGEGEDHSMKYGVMVVQANGELVLQLEPLLAKEAKQNQIQHKVINSSLSANSPKVTNKLTGIDRRKELAKAAGIGENTISRIKNISEKAPEEIKQW